MYLYLHQHSKIQVKQVEARNDATIITKFNLVVLNDLIMVSM